ncbi:MAG: hypothetical protein MJE68_24885 [Proteobacteria bacterium]|nr:hypothetical protein [Pseudomonadota bacterium]
MASAERRIIKGEGGGRGEREGKREREREGGVGESDLPISLQWYKVAIDIFHLKVKNGGCILH